MQIVIDIPESIYDTILDDQIISREQLAVLQMHILKGTLLPKGHGDLIDRDDLLADSYCIDDWSGNEVNIVDVMTVNMADIIIEADNGEEE